MIEFEVSGRKGVISERHAIEFARFLNKNCDTSWSVNDVLPSRAVSDEDKAAHEAAHEKVRAQRAADEAAREKAEAEKSAAALREQLAEAEAAAGVDMKSHEKAVKKAGKADKEARAAAAKVKADKILADA
tara:strand:+ start:3324 stop:3716 length:393 start_codon:yes stop_codon:yes gene_type:complete